MTEIVRAIYDMMGKYTYPALKGDVPKQHVDAFFQVTLPSIIQYNVIPKQMLTAEGYETLRCAQQYRPHNNNFIHIEKMMYNSLTSSLPHRKWIKTKMEL